MGLRDFIFGQDPADVDLDPRLAEARKRRELLAGRYTERLGGGPTPGELAILQGARTGAEQLGQQAQASAAGARGFSRLAAQSQANRLASTGQQRILGQAATAAGAQRAQDVAAAERGLLQLSDADIQQMMLEEQLRQQQAKPGALGILGTLAGAGIGAMAGGPGGAVQGAQFGGAMGSGLQQFGRRV